MRAMDCIRAGVAAASVGAGAAAAAGAASAMGRTVLGSPGAQDSESTQTRRRSRAMADAHESDYGSQHYWDNLYATRYANKTFDWYQVRPFNRETPARSRRPHARTTRRFRPSCARISCPRSKS